MKIHRKMVQGFLAGISALVLSSACLDQPIDKITSPNSPRLGVGVETDTSYIVVMKRGNDATGFARAQSVAPSHIWKAALNGFAARLTPAQAEGIRHNPAVEYVEIDGKVTIDEVAATWGHDRIDQRTLPLDGQFNSDRTGAGVTAYIIDTGIRPTHVEFGGRVIGGYSAITDSYGWVGCHFHGTHVAGTVGGATYGVAPEVKLVSVRVLDCGGSGTYSQVIQGVEWVTANAQKPAVANMSLGGGFSQAMNDAVANSIASGVTYAVAAGNSAADACDFSPASTPSALTAGASDKNDVQASFSNYGRCVDLHAPGVAILSAWNTDDTSVGTASGTSMASPHIAGVVALYLQGRPSATPQEVEDSIKLYSTKNVIEGRFPLLSSLRVADNTAPPPLPPAPSAPSNVTSKVLFFEPNNNTVAMRFEWSDNSTDEQYFMVRGVKGTETFSYKAPVNATYTNEVYVTPGTWTVTVAAENYGGATESVPVTVCVPAFIGDCGINETVPAAPSNITFEITARDYPQPDWSQVLMRWVDNATNEGGFDIQGHNTATGVGLWGTSVINSTLMYMHITEGPWIISIRSKGPGGVSEWVNGSICVPGSHYTCDTPPTPPPSELIPPSGLTATILNSGKGQNTDIRFNWFDNSNDETSFEISGTSGTKSKTFIAGADVKSYIGSVGTGIWSFTVRAVKLVNGVNQYSSPSNSVTVNLCGRKCR
jgi:subtilisin family serine protease